MTSERRINMKIVKLLNGAIKCVVDSMKDIAELIDSGKSKEINMLDLSKIGFVSNCYDSLHSKVFKKNNFPNLDYIYYNNPRGIIDKFTFANSTIQKADINCATLHQNAFSDSYLEELDVKETKCVFTTAVSSTKVREIRVSPKIREIDIDDASIRIVFKERDAQGLPVADLNYVIMNNPESYLRKHGFSDFKDLLLYSPQLFLDCNCSFTINELKTVKKVTDLYFKRKLQNIKRVEKEDTEKAEKMAGYLCGVRKRIDQKLNSLLPNKTELEKLEVELAGVGEPNVVNQKERTTADSEGKDDK